MQLAILSDMHVPGQADALPDEFTDRVADADHVVHAGDFGSLAALETVRNLAADLTAVYGNADPIDAPLPSVAAAEVGDVTFVVHHGEVNPVERAVYHTSEGIVKQRDDWLDAAADVATARAEEPVVGVAGHSHEVEDEIYDGVRVLNPGSSTAAGPAEEATIMTATVVDGDIDVTLHEA